MTNDSCPANALPEEHTAEAYLPPPSEAEFLRDELGIVARLSRGDFDDQDAFRLNHAAQRLAIVGGFE